MGDATVYAKWKSKFGKRGVAVTDTVPAKVVVTPSSTSQAVGSRVNLTAAVTTVTGRALPGHLVRWTSTDSRYVTVTATGVATAVQPGNSKIIAAASGKAADTAAVTVASAAISTISVSPSSQSLSSGQKVQLNAHAADAKGNQLTGRAVGWASSDESVATVSTSGVVTAVEDGTATITATAEGVHGHSTVHVAAGSVAKIAVAPGSVGLAAGKTQQLSATLQDAAGNTVSGHCRQLVEREQQHCISVERRNGHGAAYRHHNDYRYGEWRLGSCIGRRLGRRCRWYRRLSVVHAASRRRHTTALGQAHRRVGECAERERRVVELQYLGRHGVVEWHGDGKAGGKRHHHRRCWRGEGLFVTFRHGGRCQRRQCQPGLQQYRCR